MGSTRYKDVSIVISTFLMKCVGIWYADNRVVQRFRYCMLVFTLLTLLFCVWIQTRDIYYTWGDFSACTYVACNIMCLNIALFKILILVVHKQKFLNLIRYMEKHFWHTNYTLYELAILARWKRICIYFISSFTFFTETANVSYTVIPIIVNIGKNESDRVLPFNMWLDLPLSMTPYFEIVFTLQVLSVCTVGICYICCDNFFCIMNLHMAGQFRILQNRLQNMYSLQRNNEKHETPNTWTAKKYYSTIKNCIRQHQTLIMHSNELEEIFSPIILAQVLAFSLLICLSGYQIVLADLSSIRRCTFVALLISTMCQLFMFTYSCDCLIQESSGVSGAVYAGVWIELPMDRFGKLFRKDLQMVVMRSRRPCCLTANKFFAVSLETYTSILSTAMSYFTLLKQNSIDM